MLYERWREIVRKFPNELALRDTPSGRAWTFAQLDRTAEGEFAAGTAAFPQGNTPEFVIDVLRAWRVATVVCPLETAQARPVFPTPAQNLAHLKMTSATTGVSKLVAFTADQLAADADNIVATMGLRREWPNLAVISLAHSYGFSNLVTPLLLHGIPLILGGAPLPESVRRAAAGVDAITLPAVPAMWRAWQEANAIPDNVRLAISAGAPLPIALETEIHDRRGLKIHNFYGATECGGIAFDASEPPRSDAALAGAPMKNVSLSINLSGCLEVRGPNVGETYWPERNDALGAGCYITSDLAEIQEGLVYLRGRASDLINVAGRKISPEAIERLLLQHEAVRDCLVFGVASNDPHRGEEIVACVAAQNGVTAGTLRSFLLRHSEAWQVPREFWLLESLGTDDRGKRSRAEWRRKFLAAR